MRRVLPSLNALRAFEAVGREESITRAAAELNVSPGAVSRFITLLESDLGGPLFERTARGLRLTDEGRMLLESVRASFTALRHVSERVRGQFGRKHDIVVWSYPTLAMEWLVPRLGVFKRQRPEIDLKLQTSLALPDDVLEKSTLAIVRAEDCPAERIHSPLFQEKFIPVCNPRLLDGKRTLKPSALLDFPIISTEMRHAAWLDWIEKYTGRRREPQNPLFFERSAYAIRAALEGDGIALSAHVWVAEAIARGALIAPFGDRHVPGDSLVLSTAHEFPNNSDGYIICQWLTKEVRKSENLWLKICR